MKIEIDVGEQQLVLRNEKNVSLKTYPVSTSKNGLGEKNGSFCTPRGRHIVRAKIGAGQPQNTVFVRRRPTGERWTPELHARYPGRDGSPEVAQMGKPGSIGCIRMRNPDIVELFERVPPYTPVEIRD